MLNTIFLFKKKKDCTPVKIWSMFRHGSRLPSKKEVAAGTKLFMVIILL